MTARIVQDGYGFALALVFFLTLSLTGTLALSHQKVLNDRLAYFQVARTLYEGEGFASPAKVDPRSPDTEAPYAVGERLLYPLLSAAVFHLMGPAVHTSNFVAALFRSVLLFPLFLLGKSLWGDDVALLAAVLFAFSPFYTGIGAVTMTDTTFAFFYYTTLALALSYWARQQSRWLTLAGLSLALAAWTREEGIVLLIPLLLLPLWRRKPKDLTSLALFSVPVLGARALYGWMTFGSPLYTPRPMLCMPRWELLFSLHLPSCAQYLQATGGIGGALAVRVYNAAAFLRNLVADGLVVDTGVFGLLPLTVVGVALLGLWMGRSSRSSPSADRSHVGLDRRPFLRRWLAGTLGLQFVASVGIFGLPLGIGGEGGIRQAQVVLPYLLIVASAGLIAIWNRGWWGRVLTGVSLAHFALFSFMAHSLLIGSLTAPPSPNAEIKLLQRVSQDLPANSVIMSRRPNRAAYLTGRPAVMLPFASNREAVDYARRHHVTHLLLTAQERRSRPWLVKLLNTYPGVFRKMATVGRVELYSVQLDGLDENRNPALWGLGPNPTAPVRVHWQNFSRYRVRNTWEAFVTQLRAWSTGR
jgi:hypothetical protein